MLNKVENYIREGISMFVVYPSSFSKIAAVLCAAILLVIGNSALAELKKMSDEEASEVHGQGGITKSMVKQPDKIDKQTMNQSLKMAEKLSDSLPDRENLNLGQDGKLGKVKAKIETAKSMMKVVSKFEDVLKSMNDSGMNESMKLGLKMFAGSGM